MYYFLVKLATGIRFGDYVVSYGDRPNDFEQASNCESTAPVFESPPTSRFSTDLKRKFCMPSNYLVLYVLTDSQ